MTFRALFFVLGCISVFGFPQYLQAQKPYPISLQGWNLHADELDIRINQVIDDRPKLSRNIGQICFNFETDQSECKAILNTDLQESLDKLFRNSFSDSSSKPSFNIKIKQLEIKEYTKTLPQPEFGLSSIEVEFYEDTDEGFNELIMVLNHEREVTNPDVTPYHARNIVELLYESLDLFSARRASGGLRTASSNSVENGDCSSKMLKRDVYEYGVYQDYLEFWTNSPSINSGVVLNAGERKGNIKSISGISAEELKLYQGDLIGFSDTKNVYLLHGSKYYKLNKMKSGFYFSTNEKMEEFRETASLSMEDRLFIRAANLKPKNMVYYIDMCNQIISPISIPE